MTIPDLKVLLDSHKRRFVRISYRVPTSDTPIRLAGYIVAVGQPTALHCYRSAVQMAVPVLLDNGHQFYVTNVGVVLDSPEPAYYLTDEELAVLERVSRAQALCSGSVHA